SVVADGWAGGIATWLADDAIESALLSGAHATAHVEAGSGGHRGSDGPSISGCGTCACLYLTTAWPRRLTILTPWRIVHTTPISPCGTSLSSAQLAWLIALRPLHSAVSIGCSTPTHRAPSATIPNMA